MNVECTMLKETLLKLLIFIFLDMEAVQLALFTKIENREMTPEEVCAACLGLKKIADFKVNNKYLRSSLYKQLIDFTPSGDQLDDFFIITLLTTLSKGNVQFLDQVDLVSEMLDSMVNYLDKLQIETVIKLLTYPQSLRFTNEGIEEFIFSDIETKLDHIETWDLVQICSHLSKQQNENLPVDKVLENLNKRLDNVKNNDEIMELIECFHYLSHLKIFSEKFNKLIFSEINRLPQEMFTSKDIDLPKIAEMICTGLIDKLNVTSDDREKNIERNTYKRISVFTRIPAFISYCYSLEMGANNSENCQILEPVRCYHLSR